MRFAVVMLAVSPGGSAVAEIINVPGDFATIQAAIDAAVDGDEVVVADGTYTGAGNRNLDLRGKALTLRSENGSDTCSIDCQGAGRGFIIQTGEASSTVIEGFTVQNGYDGFLTGAGVFVFGAGPTFVDCRFVSCNAETYGGAAAVWFGSDPTFTGCAFLNSSAAVQGGGLFSSSDSAARLAGCIVQGNMPVGAGNPPMCYGNDSDDPVCEFGVGLQNHMLPPGLYPEYGVTTGKHVQAPGSALRGYSDMTAEEFVGQYSDAEILFSFVNWLAEESIDIHDPEIVISWYVDEPPMRPKNWGELLDEDPVLYFRVIEAYKNRLEIADSAFDGKLMLWGFTGLNGNYGAAFAQMYEGFEVAIALGVLDHVAALGVNHFIKTCPTDPYYLIKTTNRVNQEVDMMAALLGDAGLTGTKTWAPFFTLQYSGSQTCNDEPVHPETLRLNSDLYQAAKEAGEAPDLDMIWFYDDELPPFFTTQLASSQMVPLHCFCDGGEPAPGGIGQVPNSE